MKLALTASRPKTFVIGKPPIFVILCVLLWAVALVAAFTHPGVFGATGDLPVVLGP